MLKERRERPISTPLETTSTDAMDTEEAQEFSKEIAEKVIERELKKQKYEQYQQVKQTSNYQVPKSITIPVPDLNKPRQEKASRPTSVLSNFDVARSFFYYGLQFGGQVFVFVVFVCIKLLGNVCDSVP